MRKYDHLPIWWVLYNYIEVSSRSYALLFLGLSLFLQESGTCNYAAHSFNFYLFPAFFAEFDRKFSCQVHIISFEPISHLRFLLLHVCFSPFNFVDFRLAAYNFWIATTSISLKYFFVIFYPFANIFKHAQCFNRLFTCSFSAMEFRFSMNQKKRRFGRLCLTKRSFVDLIGRGYIPSFNNFIQLLDYMWDIFILFWCSELDEDAVQQSCSRIAQWLATAEVDDEIVVENEYGSWFKIVIPRYMLMYCVVRLQAQMSMFSSLNYVCVFPTFGHKYPNGEFWWRKCPKKRDWSWKKKRRTRMRTGAHSWLVEIFLNFHVYFSAGSWRKC